MDVIKKSRLVNIQLILLFGRQGFITCNLMSSRKAICTNRHPSVLIGFINWPLLNKNRLKQMPVIQGRPTLFGDYAVAVFRLAHNGQERTFCQFYSAPYYSERVHYIAYYSRFFESSYGFYAITAMLNI